MRRRIAVAIFLILIVLVLAVPPIYSYWESLPQASYKIGEEIKNFPIDGISITVTNFSTSAASSSFIEVPYQYWKMAIVNVTIRNLAGYTLFFNQSNIEEKLSEATNMHFVLTYNLKYSSGSGGGSSSPQLQDNYADWWGVTILGVGKNDFNSLTSNESVNGSILFFAPGGSPSGNGTFTSFQLVCKSVFQQKPLFAVGLTQ